MTESTKRKEQREKFLNKLFDSHWDAGILADKLIKLVEKERLK